MVNADDWKYIQEDEFLAQFLTKIDSKDDATNLLKNVMSLSGVMEKLTQGICELDKALLNQVLERNEDLMSQLDWIEKLGNVLKDMTMHVQSLVTWVERVRIKVVEPYSRLESQTLVLSRVNEACDLLTRALGVIQLAKKLPGQPPLKAALIIYQLEELCHDVDLSGLQMVEAEFKLIKKETARVEKQALSMVSSGLQALDQVKVGEGIEIMRRLGIADKEVEKLMESGLKQIEESVEYALDISNLVPQSRGGPGRVSGTSIPGNIQSFRSKLWAAWEHVLNTSVFPLCAQMVIVQNILNNKVNGNMSINFGAGETISIIASTFWTSADSCLKKQLDLAANDSSHVKQALQGEYPKLLRLHLDLHKQLKSLEADADAHIFPPMGSCVKQFETAYLSRSLKLVLDSVRDMFPDSVGIQQPPPSVDRVDTLVKTISSELSVSMVDETLSKPVANNIAKAISLFCQKSEQMVINGPEAVQVIDAPTDAQILNISIINIVFYLSEQIKSVVSNLSLNKASSKTVLNSLESCTKLCQLIISPLLESITEAINSILLTMHNEDFNIKKEGSVSLYMRELKEFISRAVATYLGPIHNQQLIASMCLGVASRCFELFIRNASLLRPLSTAGRKKLVADFKSIEDAVSPLCSRLSELGQIYSTLRSVRPLLMASCQDVASSPVLGQVIPYSLALIMLFSMGPEQLPSPHQSVGWSVKQLSDWMDKQKSEEDRLEFLSGAMHKYEQTVLRSNQASLHPVYPVMKQLLDKAMVHIRTN